MEIIIFIAGIIVGAIITFIATKFAEKNSKQTTDTTIQNIQKEMQLYFENIANKALKENSHELNNQNKEKLLELLTPFREQIANFEKKVSENTLKETEQFAKLGTNIAQVVELSNQLSQDTNKLATALKGDAKTQGRWGELVLERILEVSGLRKGEEFLTQKNYDGKKPDAVVLLPENRCIYIDAKTSLAPYDNYINAKDDNEKEQGLKEFKDSVKNHITGLAKREYFEIPEYNSPEYVLMFIPIEGCYSLLFADDAQLWDLAWKNKIMPVSPSNLLATLKIINSFHTVKRQNDNAQEIASLAGKMINKFANLCTDLQKIETTFKSALTKLNGKDNIIRNIERIEELGAKDVKALPNLDILEIEEN